MVWCRPDVPIQMLRRFGVAPGVSAMTWAAARLLDRDERALVETAERLADERFAPRAAAIDEAAAFPHEDFDDLRAHKLHLMRVPRASGFRVHGAVNLDIEHVQLPVHPVNLAIGTDVDARVRGLHPARDALHNRAGD